MKDSKPKSIRVVHLEQKNLDCKGSIEVVVTELVTQMAKIGLNVTCCN